MNINTNGAGLGLTICKGIVEQLGGNIKIKSIYGEGTKITFIVKNHIQD